MNSLQTQLEQSRLREAELLGALKEMQDKVLDLEKVWRWGEGRDHSSPLVSLVFISDLNSPFSSQLCALLLLESRDFFKVKPHLVFIFFVLHYIKKHKEKKTFKKT